MPARKVNSNATRAATNPALAPLGTERRWWQLSHALLGMLLVWSWLAPQDATSVYEGGALSQNLVWLLLAVLAPIACSRMGVSYRCSARAAGLLAVGLLWLLWCTFQAGQGTNPRIAWNGFWQVIALAACYFSARGLLVGPRSRQSIGWLWLIGCLALSLQGLYQVWVEFPADRARYLADPESVIAEVPNLEAPPGSPARKRFEDRLLHSSEPYASFALTNSLAAVLSGGLVLLVGLSLSRLELALHNKSEVPHRLRLATPQWLALLAALLLLLLCWFLTRSRVAYPALLLAAGYWIIWGRSSLATWRRWLPWIVGSVGGVGLLALLWLLANDRLVLSEAPKSLSYRLEYWLATLAMLRDHGLFGIGMGNYQSYYPLYKLPAASEIIADPHNWLLDLWINLSLPLGLALSWWIVARLCFRSWVDSEAADVQRSTTAASAIDPQQADALASRSLLWGAVVGGGVCAGLLSLLSGLNGWSTLLSWTAAGWLVWCLRPWLVWPNVGESTMPLATIARTAAVAMLGCLLASGSWQASGIAFPLVLLLILGNSSRLPLASLASVPRAITTPATDTAQPKQDTSPSNSGLWARWSSSLFPTLALLIFLIQCWRPTTTSWSLIQQALGARTAAQQLRLLEEAAVADPLDTEPLRLRAQLLTREATMAPASLFPDLAQQAQEAVAEWIAVDTIKPLNWEWAGQHALELAATARRHGLPVKMYVDQALGHYRQAVARYPSGIGLRIQLAATLALAKTWNEAQTELDKALELDRQTPHLDKKIAAQQVYLPWFPPGADSEPNLRGLGGQPMVPAEPMVEWLRKTISERTASEFE